MEKVLGPEVLESESRLWREELESGKGGVREAETPVGAPRGAAPDSAPGAPTGGNRRQARRTRESKLRGPLRRRRREGGHRSTRAQSWAGT